MSALLAGLHRYSLLFHVHYNQLFHVLLKWANCEFSSTMKEPT
jgi:hypothetical protein